MNYQQDRKRIRERQCQSIGCLSDVRVALVRNVG